MLYTLCFAFLIPTHPSNTTETEIKEWLPILVDYWRENFDDSYYRYLFIRLFSDIVTNFKDIDMREYNEFIFYQLYYTFSSFGKGDSVRPFGKVFMPKYFAQYIVCIYKPKHNINGDAEINSRKEFELDTILEYFREQLHPDYPSPNTDLIRFIKLISSSL